MSFTSITKPVQGDATKKATIDAVIDDLNYLYNQISGLTGIAIPNASFEADVDADSLPDQWTRTLYAGGSFAITGTGLVDTDCNHGRRAVKFVSPGGAGNGGGYIDNNDYFEVTPNRLLLVSWQQKSTVATVRNKVQVMWYTGAQVLISTTDLYSSISNPVAWTPQFSYAIPPATARYAKLRLIGAENTTVVAGTVYFDDVRIGLMPVQNIVTVSTVGTWSYSLPTGVNVVFAEVIGGGGGGASGNGGANGGAGGGGGARCYAVITAAGTHTLIIGAGGAGGAVSNNGIDGGQSSIDGIVLANGGIKGVVGAVAGGTGGTASGGIVNESGTDGVGRVGAAGGNGGPSAVGIWGLGGLGGGVAGKAALFGGGGGGGNASGAGGNGGDGIIILRW